MAASLKYGKLDIPGIGEDEPVFIVRAQDRLSVPLIVQYWYKGRWQGCAWEHLDGIEAVRAAFALYQAGHGAKLPDSPAPEAVVQLVQDDEPPPDEPAEEPATEPEPPEEAEEEQLETAAEG